MSDSSLFWQIDAKDVLISPVSPAQQQNAYLDYLSLWQDFNHPGAIELKSWQFDSAVGFRLQLAKNPGFQATADANLSWYEKLAALRQGLHLQHHGVDINLHPRQLWFHPAGYARWLPLTPAQFHAPKALNADLSALRQAWFDDGSESLLPFTWAWQSCWQAYEQQPGQDWDRLFNHLLGSAWIYMAAQRLAMKDHLLAWQEAKQLADFGELLGLNAEQRQHLDRLAQQESPNLNEFMHVFNKIQP